MIFYEFLREGVKNKKIIKNRRKKLGKKLRKKSHKKIQGKIKKLKIILLPKPTFF